MKTLGSIPHTFCALILSEVETEKMTVVPGTHFWVYGGAVGNFIYEDGQEYMVLVKPVKKENPDGIQR